MIKEAQMSNKKLTAAERRRDEDFAGIVAGLEVIERRPDAVLDALAG